MITFKQQFSFSEESVKNFALFLGWTEKIEAEEEVEQIIISLEGEEIKTIEKVKKEIDNPETFVDFVDRLAKEHSLQFTKQWANVLLETEIQNKKDELDNKIRPQLEQVIIKPVEDALITEVVL